MSADRDWIKNWAALNIVDITFLKKKLRDQRDSPRGVRHSSQNCSYSKRNSPKEGLNIVHKIVPIAVEKERVEMSDYVKKALESTDVSEIKRVFGMEEGI